MFLGVEKSDAIPSLQMNDEELDSPSEDKHAAKQVLKPSTTVITAPSPKKGLASNSASGPQERASPLINDKGRYNKSKKFESLSLPL